MSEKPSFTKLTLERSLSSTRGTFGHLSLTNHTGTHHWTTCERPATGPHPRIPAGTYALALGMYYHGDGPGGKEDYPAYEVLAVPGRSFIKIHRANFAKELLGCIAPGMGYFTDADGIYGVTLSKTAFEQFMAALVGERNVELIITEQAA